METSKRENAQWEASIFPGYVKSECASPTVSTDGVIITSMIEAYQGRAIAVADLPNAFSLRRIMSRLSCY